MIDPIELEICKRRGHDIRQLAQGWRQCKWCGMWLRNVNTVEEREDDPPRDEQDSLSKLLP